MVKQKLLTVLSLLTPLFGQVTPLEDYTSSYSAYQEDPSSIENLVNLAKSSFKMGAFDQSQNIINIILEKDPKNLDALLLEGRLYIALKKFPEAGVSLGKILEHDAHSTQALEAKKLAKSIATLSAKYHSSYLLKVTTGFDSNSNYVNSDDMQSYFSQLDCPNPDGCSYTDIQQKQEYYSEIFAIGNYLYDFGDRGGFYIGAGWDALYHGFEGLTYSSFSLTTGLGYRNRSGQYYFPITLGKFTTNLPFTASDWNGPIQNYPDGLNYHTSGVNPNYSYSFKNGAIFTTGLSHYEIVSDEEFTQTDTMTGKVYTDPLSRLSSDSLYFQFDDTIGIGKAYHVRFYLHSNKSENNYQYTPYSEYGDGTGINIFYHHPVNPQWSVNFDGSFETREYSEHYVQGAMMPFDYNYDTDSDNIFRNDKSMELNLEALYAHSAKIKSAVGYTFVLNSSNYTPQDYTKHKLYYALYWLP